jgi:hypothetical protein
VVRAVNRPVPVTARDRWWSAQWVVAATLLEVDLHDAAHVRAIEDAAELVKISAGGDSVLEIDGRSIPLARPEATPADLLAKWRRLNPVRKPPRGLLS